MESEFFDVAKIAESGQCFRLLPLHDGRYQLVAMGRLLLLDPRTPGRMGFACGEAEFTAIWRSYFHLDGEYAAYHAAIPKDDAFLQAAARFGRGIRILRQEPWEMLVSFIISQRKNLPGIRTCVSRLCELCGQPIEGGAIRAFPTPEALADQPLDALSACGLGYRGPYIKQTAQMVARGQLNLSSISALPDHELLEELRRAPGVGVKVASCVMLFGYHRLDAFPIDVWIERVLERRYHGAFDPTPYRGFAGVLQQYMFFYERAMAKSGASGT